MRIKQLHFPQIDSTQTYLIENYHSLAHKDAETLITTEHQSAGHGRRGSDWLHFGNSLAFSFTLTPHPVLTLTALELAVLLKQSIEHFFQLQLQLKWPNDLFFLDDKVGGIIVQNLGNNKVAVGVGLNLGDDENASGYHGLPAQNLHRNDQQEIPYKIVNFILQHRLEDYTKIKQQFEAHCLHLNCFCKTQEGSGLFKGIGNLGQALIEDSEGKIIEVFSGSLYLR